MHQVMIIPAAGAGSRLGASVPKALVPVNGRPMLKHLLALYSGVVDEFVTVVSPTARNAVHETCADSTVAMRTAVQAQPTGMLDAILIPMPMLIERRPCQVWITWCDQIAVHEDTVRKVADCCSQEPGKELIMPTVHRQNPYIHFSRDSRGAIVDILHQREGDVMPEVGESDMGLFVLSDTAYFDLLPRFARETLVGAATGERNFLPFIPWLSRYGSVLTLGGGHCMESIGINTPEDLSLIENWLRND
jgi:bifunctional N-acetylglucosamine-1-phosphate-uridyltransferase/glucosamine-1-phosphate-acetyltransferase GlmU-like protein